MAITALFMGVVGGPHCVAMCGAACAGISRAAGARSTQALWSFQLSRMVGYSLFGAFAAGSVQGLALLGTIAANLQSCTADAEYREAAVITLLVTASGASFASINPATNKLLAKHHSLTWQWLLV